MSIVPIKDFSRYISECPARLSNCTNSCVAACIVQYSWPPYKYHFEGLTNTIRYISFDVWPVICYAFF